MDERRKELDRLRYLANYILSDLDLVYAALKSVDPAYFYKSNREPIEKLLTSDFVGAALVMYRFVGKASDISDTEDGSKIVRQILMGSILAYLRKICGYDEAAIKEVRASVEFDPCSYSIFDDL